MRQSNTYIYLFSGIMTIVLGGMLSFAAEVLKPFQKKQIELDTKKQILGAVMQLNEQDDVLAIYDDKIQSIVVTYNGDVVEQDDSGKPLIAEKVNIEKNFKLDPKERLFPVFKYNEGDKTTYILPIFGNGLWNNIWGYVALGDDFNTIKGIALDHRGETPGLGARITEKEVQERYKSKKVYNSSQELVGVSMVKGEGKGPHDDHHIDGMAGATITGNGVNEMILNYLGYYENYFKKEKQRN